MDKAAVIARVASDPADRLLLARVLDQYEKAERRGIPAATVFLSPREQAMAQALLNTLGVRSGYVFDGGYEGAERKLLAFLPDWAEDAAGELAFFRAAFRDKDAVLTHRDILGSLMGLGITRERVGDILVSPHSADVVASPSLGDFFLREWDSAGRTRLAVTEIGREELLVPEAAGPGGEGHPGPGHRLLHASGRGGLRRLLHEPGAGRGAHRRGAGVPGPQPLPQAGQAGGGGGRGHRPGLRQGRGP